MDGAHWSVITYSEFKYFGNLIRPDIKEDLVSKRQIFIHYLYFTAIQQNNVHIYVLFKIVHYFG